MRRAARVAPPRLPRLRSEPRARRHAAAGLVVAGLALAAAFATGCSAPEPPPAPATPSERLAADERIAWLLAPCPKSEYYDRDTSNLVPLLVGKLAVAEPAPLQRAKEALIEIGADAVPELARLMNRHFPDRLGTAYVQNALEVLSGIDDPSAREPVLRGLEHPAVSIRAVAVRGLRKFHARPEDYDMLRDRFAVEALDLQQSLALALHAADPARAENEYLDWVERDEHDRVWIQVLPFLAASERAEISARCRRDYPDAVPSARAWLAAAAAREGDEAARASLRADLHREDSALRTNAVKAATTAGLLDELGPVLLDDPDPELRQVAATDLGAAASTPERVAWLQRGLDDPSPDVRNACMIALVRRDDPSAVDRLLFLLGGSRNTFASAVVVLQQTLDENPGIAPRVLSRLLERAEGESHLSVAKRASIYQAIGVLPLAEAAEALLELGRTTDEKIQGMRAHRWMTLTASNTGIPGRTVLRDALAVETDPIRRIDLLWAISARRDELARDTLLAVVESETTHPYELVFAAERLPQVAPPGQVAPLLKRVTLRVHEDAARRALQCLLWRWY